MENQIDELAGYIRTQASYGTDENQIRKTLNEHGWSEVVVNQAFTLSKIAPENIHADSANAAALPNNKVRNGVLWILSPFIVLVGTGILSSLLRAMGLQSVPLSLLFLLLGLVGFVLIFVGPIIGIVTLSKKA